MKGCIVNRGFENETHKYRRTFFIVARGLTKFLGYSKDLRRNRVISYVELVS